VLGALDFKALIVLELKSLFLEEPRVEYSLLSLYLLLRNIILESLEIDIERYT